MTQIDAETFEFEENRNGEPGLILDLPGGSQVVAQPDLFAEIMETYRVEYNNE